MRERRGRGGRERERGRGGGRGGWEVDFFAGGGWRREK